MPSPLWHEAAAFAGRVHEHQCRQDGRTPYAVHPSRVAMIVSAVFGVHDETVLAAAYLHDTIEDTGTDYDDLSARFGPEVAECVAALTKDMRLEEAERERAYDEQLAAGPWSGRLIKLADVYDNLLDAATDAARRKLLDRARRALALAAGEERLAPACERLRALAARVEAEMGTARPG